ncbi:hypothetical protein ILYODFUR_021077, partial [Ilyodon furcidens]
TRFLRASFRLATNRTEIVLVEVDEDNPSCDPLTALRPLIYCSSLALFGACQAEPLCALPAGFKSPVDCSYHLVQ